MLRRIFKKRSLDRDLADELQEHLDMEVDLLIGRGFSRDAILRPAKSFPTGPEQFSFQTVCGTLALTQTER